MLLKRSRSIDLIKLVTWGRKSASGRLLPRGIMPQRQTRAKAKQKRQKQRAQKKRVTERDKQTEKLTNKVPSVLAEVDHSDEENSSYEGSEYGVNLDGNLRQLPGVCNLGNVIVHRHRLDNIPQQKSLILSE